MNVNPLFYPDLKTQSSLKAVKELFGIKMMFLRKEGKKQVLGELHFHDRKQEQQQALINQCSRDTMHRNAQNQGG